mmetsp:Transcript_11530/g.43045  ORF Transcript_11530/g.43045 Transcript_11530/m.43045 type:complete len:320 (-) Transcript_11530:634-1593(-)
MLYRSFIGGEDVAHAASGLAPSAQAPQYERNLDHLRNLRPEKAVLERGQERIRPERLVIHARDLLGGGQKDGLHLTGEQVPVRAIPTEPLQDRDGAFPLVLVDGAAVDAEILLAQPLHALYLVEQGAVLHLDAAVVPEDVVAQGPEEVALQGLAHAFRHELGGRFQLGADGMLALGQAHERRAGVAQRIQRRLVGRRLCPRGAGQGARLRARGASSRLPAGRQQHGRRLDHVGPDGVEQDAFQQLHEVGDLGERPLHRFAPGPFRDVRILRLHFVGAQVRRAVQLVQEHVHQVSVEEIHAPSDAGHVQHAVDLRFNRRA